MTVAGEKTGTRFKDIVEEIATGLKTGESAGKNNEYAFILLTAALGKCDSYGTRIGGTYVDGNQAWMDAIRNELAEMTADANDTYRIYTGEITPTTTIKDVAGHIIIKVNYSCRIEIWVTIYLLLQMKYQLCLPSGELLMMSVLGAYRNKCLCCQYITMGNVK